jgi:tetratricopeptide (TPR) repeat protein
MDKLFLACSNDFMKRTAALISVPLLLVGGYFGYLWIRLAWKDHTIMQTVILTPAEKDFRLKSDRKNSIFRAETALRQKTDLDEATQRAEDAKRANEHLKLIDRESRCEQFEYSFKNTQSKTYNESDVNLRITRVESNPPHYFGSEKSELDNRSRQALAFKKEFLGTFSQIQQCPEVTDFRLKLVEARLNLDLTASIPKIVKAWPHTDFLKSPKERCCFMSLMQSISLPSVDRSWPKQSSYFHIDISFVFSPDFGQTRSLSFKQNKAGLVFFKIGKFDEAASSFHESIQLNPTNFAAQVNLASVYALWLKAGRKKPAESIKTAGDNVYRENEQYWDPYKHLDRASEDNPKYVGEKIRTDHAFDGLHNESRFQEILLDTAKYFAEEDIVIKSFLGTAKDGKLEKFQELYEHPVIAKMATLRSQALRIASDSGRLDILKFFQKKGWKLGECDIRPNPYAVAIDRNQIEIFDFLVANKFDTVCVQRDLDETEGDVSSESNLSALLHPLRHPVSIAAQKGYIELLKRLIKIDLKGDINHRFSYTYKGAHYYSEMIQGMTLLHIAVFGEQVAVMQYLLANGADTKMKMSWESESDADPTTKPFSGTALDLAKLHNKIEIANILESASKKQSKD